MQLKREKRWTPIDLHVSLTWEAPGTLLLAMRWLLSFHLHKRIRWHRHCQREQKKMSLCAYILYFKNKVVLWNLCIIDVGVGRTLRGMCSSAAGRSSDRAANPSLLGMLPAKCPLHSSPITSIEEWYLSPVMGTGFLPSDESRWEGRNSRQVEGQELINYPPKRQRQYLR